MLTIPVEDRRIEQIQEIEEVALRNSTFVFIYGAGVYAKALTEYLKNNGLKREVRYVLDDEFCRDSENKNDEIISISTFKREFALIAPLVFGIYNYNFILAKKEEFKNKVLYMYDFHITVIGNRIVEWERGYILDNIKSFNETYNLLSDEGSRQTMQFYLNAAIGGEFDVLYKNCKEDLLYFSGVIKDFKVEKLFDCGAYDGDSIHDFIEVFTNYKMIYAFEPDENNIKRIREREEKENIHDLHIVSKGVWSETTMLKFDSSGTSTSSINSNGKNIIKVVRLDDYLDCFDESSLIKMDIEGSELEALKGARRIIGEIHPALAICVYHKKEDLITIPQYINSLVPDGTYSYYLGFQGLDLAELVFYAIPKQE